MALFYKKIGPFRAWLWEPSLDENGQEEDIIEEDFICEDIFTSVGTEDEYIPESDSTSEDGLTTKKRKNNYTQQSKTDCWNNDNL